MWLVAAVAALLRRLRAERGVAILLFVLIALTSFAVAAGPRLFNRVADEGIRYEAERGTAIQRNLQFTVAGTVSASQDAPFGRVVDRGCPRDFGGLATPACSNPSAASWSASSSRSLC